ADRDPPPPRGPPPPVGGGGGRAPDARTGDAHGAEAESVHGQVVADGDRAGGRCGRGVAHGPFLAAQDAPPTPVASDTSISSARRSTSSASGVALPLWTALAAPAAAARRSSASTGRWAASPVASAAVMASPEPRASTVDNPRAETVEQWPSGTTSGGRSAPETPA